MASNETNKIKRTPVITILGHVDHGKTTILDQIRSSNVTAKEAGGITQKISLFTIEHEHFISGESEISKLTFVDTPGHEAFDLMRKRGGEIADIVLLIIAADDGLKPQTEESIEIIKQSNAKPIVVFNKVDLPNINLEKIKRELSTKGILVEGYGGDIPTVEVSGKTGQGIDTLLDTIGLVVSLEGTQSRGELPENVTSSTIVLESIKDARKGHVATVLVNNGTLKAGDWIYYEHGNEIVNEKVKGIVSENDEPIEQLNAGEGGRLIGLSHPLDLGTNIFGSNVKNKKLTKELFVDDQPADVTAESTEDNDAQPDWLSQMFGGETDEEMEEKQQLNVLIKSSSEGSLQAILNSLNKLDVDGYTVNIVESGVGNVTLRDVEMAEVTKAILLAFEVGVEPSASSEAEKRKVLIRTYDIIYKLLEEVEVVLTSMATPKESEEDLGNAEVREVFILSNGSKVLGGRVTSGVIKRGEKCYVVRDDEIVAEGKITSLKHGKDDVKEAAKGTDFGAIIEPSPKGAEVGDTLFCVKVVR